MYTYIIDGCASALSYINITLVVSEVDLCYVWSAATNIVQMHAWCILEFGSGGNNQDLSL